MPTDRRRPKPQVLTTHTAKHPAPPPYGVSSSNRENRTPLDQAAHSAYAQVRQLLPRIPALRGSCPPGRAPTKPRNRSSHVATVATQNDWTTTEIVAPLGTTRRSQPVARPTLASRPELQPPPSPHPPQHRARLPRPGHPADPHPATSVATAPPHQQHLMTTLGILGPTSTRAAGRLALRYADRPHRPNPGRWADRVYARR